MNKWDWVALVIAPLDNGEYNIGTGVPLSQKYILTCYHTVESAIIDNNIEIRFVVDCDKENGWRKAKIVWFSKQEKIDSALLEIDSDDKIQPFLYSNYTSDASANWDGVGFSKASARRKTIDSEYRKYTPLKGEIMVAADSSQELPLGVKYKVEDSPLWSGVSGAPVVTGNRLVGIISECEDGFDGSRLNAIPIRNLFKDPTFAAFFEVDKRIDDYTETVRAEVIDLLGNENLKYLLSKSLGLGQAETKIILTNELLNSSIENFINMMHQLIQDNKRNMNADELKDVKQLTCWVVPYLYDFLAVNAVLHKIDKENATDVQSATPPLTEIMMAAIDQRNATFKTISENRYLYGFNDIAEQVPESGYDYDNEKLVAHFDENLFIKYGIAEEKSESDIEYQRMIVNDQLEYLLYERNPKNHIYHSIQTRSNIEKDKIEFIKQHYPHIFFLILNKQLQDKRMEQGLGRKLKGILQS